MFIKISPNLTFPLSLSLSPFMISLSPFFLSLDSMILLWYLILNNNLKLFFLVVHLLIDPHCRRERVIISEWPGELFLARHPCPPDRKASLIEKPGLVPMGGRKPGYSSQVFIGWKTWWCMSSLPFWKVFPRRRHEQPSQQICSSLVVPL